MQMLSHSDTHHLNRHMVGCGCHAILIQYCYVHSSESLGRQERGTETDTHPGLFYKRPTGQEREEERGKTRKHLRKEKEEAGHDWQQMSGHNIPTHEEKVLRTKREKFWKNTTTETPKNMECNEEEKRNPIEKGETRTLARTPITLGQKNEKRDHQIVDEKRQKYDRKI